MHLHSRPKYPFAGYITHFSNPNLSTDKHPHHPNPSLRSLPIHSVKKTKVASASYMASDASAFPDQSSHLLSLPWQSRLDNLTWILKSHPFTLPSKQTKSLKVPWMLNSHPPTHPQLYLTIDQTHTTSTQQPDQKDPSHRKKNYKRFKRFTQPKPLNPLEPGKTKKGL